MTLPEGFKMTELGALPKEWGVVRLIEVAEKMKAGGTPKRGKMEYWGGNIPFVLIEDITNSGLYITKTKERITQEGLENSSAWIVPPNSLLLTMYATIGATAINKIPLATNQAILAIISKSNFNIIYGAYCLKYHAQRLEMQNIQSTQKNVNKGIVGNFEIPLPPPHEQHRIAAVLSAVQDAKEKTGAVIAAAKSLKKSLMRHLFTYGPVPAGAAESVPLVETEIGLVPEGWEVVRLGDVFDLKQGKQLSARESTEGKIKKPFLRTSNVLWGNVNIEKVDEMFFTLTDYEKLRLKYGDVLVCEGGDVGRTSLYRDELKESAYQNHLHRLRPKQKNVNPEFFVDWMIFAVTIKKMYIHAANRTTIPNLSGSRLKNFKIPLPPLPIQQKIASILSTVDKKIEAEENKKNALDELFKSLLHNLMTGKVRVNHLEVTL
jgi:type I restriction enzyme S subunit